MFSLPVDDIKQLSVGFFFYGPVKIPTNYREYYVSRELLRRGHKALWFVNVSKENYPFDEKIPSLPLGKFENIRLWYLRPFFLAAALKRNGINCAWISGWAQRWPKALYWQVMVLKIAGIKIVYDPIDPIYEYTLACDSYSDNTQEHEKTKKLMEKIYKLCDVVFIVTEELRDLLVENGAPASKLHVAWWGSNSDLFSNVKNDLRKELKLESKFVVGWLGSMTPFKGIEEVIIPLFRKLYQKYNDICFLVGGRGPLENKLFAFKEEVGDAMLLLGNLPYELAPAFTKTLDVYVVPVMTNSIFSQSIRPVKLFDALISGIPCVTSKTASLEKIKDIFPSLSYAEDNPNSFFDCIVTLRRNINKRKLIIISRSASVQFSLQNVSTSIVDKIEREFIKER